LSRLRSASARLVGDGNWSWGIGIQVDRLSASRYSEVDRLSAC
jgi:hypothetical protein